MTQHSSLKNASVGARHRNVLKRHERIRQLQDAETLSERQSVYKLPKIKLIKLKVKKAKGGKETEGQAEAGAAPSAPPAQAAPTAVSPRTSSKAVVSEKPKEKSK